jgi:hypothetical protein
VLLPRLQGWKLPTPVPEEYWGRLTTWALDTSESEDLEEKRREIYGPGGGSPFGEVRGCWGWSWCGGGGGRGGGLG